MFTMDAIDELNDDLLMPSGDYLSFQDLGINPQKASLTPDSLCLSNEHLQLPTACVCHVSSSFAIAAGILSAIKCCP